MKLSQRTQQLKALFSYEKNVSLDDSRLDIRSFSFRQRAGEQEIDAFQQKIPVSDFCHTTDNGIVENKSFHYTVFVPRTINKTDQAILLLHGLNERNWEKYLTWAEQLALNTGKAVILFPIAFHMNRTPSSWYNPRLTLPWVNKRKKKITNLNNSTFANVALSSRLSESPLRFYISGRETIYNIWQLLSDIRKGMHPLFLPSTRVNIFAYSIGALVAQILLMANPEGLISESRLFLFCGGSIFSRMNGNARDIIDQEAFERVKEFYLNHFLNEEYGLSKPETYKEDRIAKAFRAMITPSELKEYREELFENVKKRIRVITLKKDTVMPTVGVREAFGSSLASDLSDEWDFPFPYSHQHPFPSKPFMESEPVYQAFKRVMGSASAFLG